MLTNEQIKKLDEISWEIYKIYKDFDKGTDSASIAYAQLLFNAVQAIDTIGIINNALPF